MMADALTKQGHKIVEWKPPSHKRGLDIIENTWSYDGGGDVHGAFALSGEPMSKQISLLYRDKPGEQMYASGIAVNNVAKRQYQKEYMDYWNSTSELTDTGRPADAFSAPLAPYAAARPERYGYYGYTSIENGLDYTSGVVPVTTCDQNLDVADKNFKAISDAVQKAFDDYDAELYEGAHVSVQLVGRSFQEEKMLILAEYAEKILRGA